MTQILKYCFDNPWRPILFFAITVLLFAVAELSQNKAFIDFTFGLFVLGLIGFFISSLWQLKRRKPLSALLSFAVFALGVFGFFLLVTAQFVIGLLLPDRYADNLKIPENIEIYRPKEDRYNENNSGDSLAISRKANDFELYKSFQPGFYEYDIWLG